MKIRMNKERLVLLILLILAAIILAIGTWQSHYDFKHHLKYSCIENTETGSNYSSFTCKEAVYYMEKVDLHEK